MKAILIIFSVLGLLFWTAVASYWVGYNAEHPVAPVVEPTYPTGYEVFNAANEYRAKQGLAPLTLSKSLCNNIAARQQNYIATKSHDGLQEFVDEWMPQEQGLFEILAWGTSGQDVVSQWASSPSHDVLLKEATRGCAYSAQGYSVMLMH